MQPLKTKRVSGQRHFLAAFFISFLWGMFGADRMYLGKWGTGFLKLITLGGAGLWVIIDLLLIMTGVMRDKQGRELLQVKEYKRFAYWTVLIFALILGLIVLVTGVLFILALGPIFEMLQGGGIESLSEFVPDWLQLGTPIPPELQEYY